MIGPAMREAGPFWAHVGASGFGMGVVLVVGFILIPQVDSIWTFLAGVWALYGLMLVALVVVPARILGVPRQHERPKQTIGRWVTGGALSMVAMAPGFVLARLGVAMFEVPGLHLVGLLLLTLGTVLYAAAMSSVKAVKLSMKLEPRSERDAPRPSV